MCGCGGSSVSAKRAPRQGVVQQQAQKATPRGDYTWNGPQGRKAAEPKPA